MTTALFHRKEKGKKSALDFGCATVAGQVLVATVVIRTISAALVSTKSIP